MEESKKKRNRIIISSVVAGICLAAAAVSAAIILMQKNPLAKGIAGLAKEVMALEEEMGENFWTNAVNQMGSGNMQAEYSWNIGGILALQNITVGLDGETKRDMERQLFETDVQVSVANTKITEASVYGTEDTLFFQVPSIWDGSIVMEPKNLSGQWNDSAIRAQLEKLIGRELGISRRIDAKLFWRFSLEPFSASDFFQENADALKTLYQNMEVLKLEKAQEKKLLSMEQAESLKEYALKNTEKNTMETMAYLVVLPKEELGNIFQNVTSDIRLCVYLDAEKRIVRICTLPGEVLATKAGEGEIAINLTGKEATIDRLELALSVTADADKISSALPGKMEADGNVIIEKKKEEKRSFAIECDSDFRYLEKTWELSLEGGIRGERTDAGDGLSLEMERLTLKKQDTAICRMSGKTAFKPLAENIEKPAGKEYRIGEMSALETVLFLANCMENIYKNYSGYIKLMQ